MRSEATPSSSVSIAAEARQGSAAARGVRARHTGLRASFVARTSSALLPMMQAVGWFSAAVAGGVVTGAFGPHRRAQALRRRERFRQPTASSTPLGEEGLGCFPRTWALRSTQLGGEAQDGLPVWDAVDVFVERLKGLALRKVPSPGFKVRLIDAQEPLRDP